MADREMAAGQLAIEVPHETCGEACGEEPNSGCTVFALAKGDQVFFGGNDDYISLDSYYWVDQGGEGRYGVIWVGTPDNVQQGVNEMGLAYDGTSLPRVYTNPHPERLPVPGGYADYPVRIMQENTTVAEVIEWIQTHQRYPFMHDQLQFADARGDSVVISPGQDGELIFTRKPSGDGFLVSTNLNVANPSHGQVSSRYSNAQRVLGELLNRPGRLTPEDGASVLDAVHDEGGQSWTRSSLLADLPNGKVYLYYFYQFDKPIVLDVSQQLADPLPPGALSQLFPQDVQQEATRRYQRLQNLPGQCRAGGAAWLGLVAVSLIGFALLRRGRSESAFWWLVMLVIGPLGLLIWGLTIRRGYASGRRLVLTEAAGDLASTVSGFLIALIVILSSPNNQSSEQRGILLFLGLPLLIGLLMVHGPVLIPVAKVNYPRLIWLRLPHVVVATLLSLTGIFAASVPLINLGTSKCEMLDLRDATIGTVWAGAAIGALAGLLLLFVYQAWAVGRGYRAWSASAAGEVVFSTPGWRQLWWWILLAFAALLGSVVVGQYLQGLLTT